MLLIMKKNKLFYCLLLALFFIPKGQAQQSVVSSGGNAIGSGGNASYTIGQVVYTSATGSGGSVNQGVQQPFEIFTLGTDNFPEITLQMTVYPNPTTSLVYLNIENYIVDNLEYQLFDLSGRLITNQKISQSETQIQLENLPSAIYLLNVLDNYKIIKTFKIIKKH